MLVVSGLLWSGASGMAQAAAAERTATCAEMNPQLWSFKATQVIAECHGRRAGRAAERTALVMGNAPVQLPKSWADVVAGMASGYAKQAAGTEDVEQAASFAHLSAQIAAAASGAAQPVIGLGGLGGFAPTTDTGHTGAELAARQAARKAWKTANWAYQAEGRDVQKNIAADQAETQAWKTARAAGWIK